MKDYAKIKNSPYFRPLVLLASVLVIFFALAFIFLSIYTRHGQHIPVPSFQGLTIEQAQQLLKEKELKMQLVVIDSVYSTLHEPGTVVEQTPKESNLVKKGRRILLTMNSMNPKMVPMPYVTGYSLRQAKNRLVASGLEVSRLVYRPDLATNNVLEQRYDGRTVHRGDSLMVQVGSKVELVVGVNHVSQAPTVPSVIGKTLYEAKNTMWEEGFNVVGVDPDGTVTEDNQGAAVVYEQNPEAFSTSYYGRSVTLRITADAGKAAQQAGSRTNRIRSLRNQIERDQSNLEILRGKQSMELMIGDSMVQLRPQDSMVLILRIQDNQALLDSLAN